MNHVFRIVWNAASGQWVVASELARSPRRRAGGIASRRIIAIAAMAFACQSVAADLTFDGNGAPPPNPTGSGTWNTSEAAWFDGTTFRAWDNLALDRAVFGVPGTVTLGTPIVAGGLHFASGTTQLTGTQGLTLSGARTISLGDEATATISAPLTGGFRLSGAANATFQLTGNNAGYAGTTTIGAGPRLVLGHSNALGTSTGADALVLEDGARLEFANNATYANNYTLTGGTVRIVPRASSGTFSGAPTLTGSTTLIYGAGNAGSQAWTGRLADTGTNILSFTVEAAEGYGPTLSGANTYSGDTRLRSGQLALANASALSANSAFVFDGRGETQATLVFQYGGLFARTLGNGAGQFRWEGSGGFRGTNGVTTVTLNGNAPLTWGAGGFVPDGESLHVGTNIVFANAIDLGSRERTLFGNGTLSGALQGNGGGVRLREGQLTLGAANTWTGATVLDARRDNLFDAQLVLGHAQALPGGIGVDGGTSALVFDGGVVVLGTKSGDFLRGLGDGAHQARFTGGGGFGSAAGLRTVDMGGAGDTLTWGAGGFVPDGASLGFVSHGAGAVVSFRNGIDLATGERTIELASTGIAPQRAVRFDGRISGNGALRMTGFGEAYLTGANTYTGRTVIGASDVSTRVAVDTLADGGLASGIGAASLDAGNLVFGSRGSNSFATLAYLGAGAQTDRNFTMIGNAELLSDGSGAMTWRGAPSVVAGDLTLRLGGAQQGNVFAGPLADGGGRLSIAKHGTGTWRLTGSNTLTGSVHIGGVGAGPLDPGVLEVDTLGNANEAGSLGINASNLASNLVLYSRGVLRYVGDGDTTNRNLMRGVQSGVPTDRAFGIALESSGTDALDWRGTVTMQNTGNAWLRLGGTNEDHNRFASVLANSAQAVALAKEGSGTWSLAAANTYTGATEIVDGLLRLDHANALAGGLGAGDASGSQLRLAGGIVGLTATSGDLLRRLGGTAGRNVVAWTAPSGGFAAFGATRAVDLGGTGATLPWNSPNFVADGGRLLLSHHTADATLDFRNGIDFANGERTVDVANGAHAIDAALSGVLSGTGASGLVKEGAGTLRVSGDNTYAGRTLVRAGVLEVDRLADAGVSSNLGIGSHAPESLQIDGATLRYLGAGDASDRGFTVGVRGATLESEGSGALALDGNVALNDATQVRTLTLTGRNTDANRLGGTLGAAGTLAIEKLGSGTWVLAGDSALAGLAIRSGTLQLGDGGASGSVGDVAIDNHGTLVFARSDVATFDNVIRGPGVLVQRGTGTTVLSGVTSQALSTSVESGTLRIDGALSTPTVAIGDGALRIRGQLQEDSGGETVITGIGGTDSTLAVETGGVLRARGDLGDGADTLIVAGVLDTGTGAMTTGDGDDTLRLGDGAVLAGRIDGGTAHDTVELDIARAFAFDPNAVNGFERLYKSGNGVATTVETGAYDAIEIASGTLRVGAGHALHTSLFRLSDGATLGVDGAASDATGGRARIEGDAGRNVVHVAAGGRLDATGALGAGVDTLDVAGVLDIGGARFELGDGDDAFVVHDGTQVIGTVDGGAGQDTRVYAIEGRATLGALHNFEALEKRGRGLLDILGPAPTELAAVDVLGGVLRIDAAATVHGVNVTTIASGATLEVDGHHAGTDGDDTFEVAGTTAGTGIIDLAAGDDTLVLRDGATLDNTVDGGDAANADRLVLDNAFAMSFDGSGVRGFEALRKHNAGTATLVGSNDSVYVAGVDVAQGTLAIGAGHVLRTSTIDVGDGATLQVAHRATDLVGNATSVRGDAGVNTVRVDAGGTLYATGDLGAGDDVLDIAGVLDMQGGRFALGDGNDRFVVHDGTHVLGTVDGGAGLDTRVYDIENLATFGALDNFEGIEKRGAGTLRIEGPDATRLEAVDVLGGLLHVRAAGGIDGVIDTFVAADAWLQVDGRYAGSNGDDGLEVAGTLSGAGVIGFGAGDDTLLASGTLSGAIDLGAGDDDVRFSGGRFASLTLAGGDGAGDRLAFAGLSMTADDLPAFTGFEHVQLVEGTTLSLDRAFDLHGGRLDIDATSDVFADGAARIDGSVANAGRVHAQATRLAIAGDYTGDAGALLFVDVATSAGTAGGLDIAGAVHGRTGVVFRGDGTSGFSSASIPIVSAPNANTSADAFYAAEAEGNRLRLAGSPFAWTLAHDAASHTWSLQTDDTPALVPELPGIAVLPTLGLTAIEDTQRIVFDRLAASRGAAQACDVESSERARSNTQSATCRDAWVALIDGELEVSGGSGFAFRGTTHGMLAGVSRVMPSREGTTFRAGAHAGLSRGDHSSGDRDLAHVRIHAARLRTASPIAGFHASLATDTGRTLDATLDAQRSRTGVTTDDGWSDTFTGSRIAMRMQAAQRFASGDWSIEPQLSLGMTAQHWSDRYDADGRDVLLADDVVGYARMGLRVARAFATPTFGSVRPWATVAIDDTIGEGREALRLRGSSGQTFSLPGHDLRHGASLEAGVDAQLRGGLRLFGTLSMAERIAGTGISQRSATLGAQWAW